MKYMKGKGRSGANGGKEELGRIANKMRCNGIDPLTV
jgi:hypothetical protein